MAQRITIESIQLTGFRAYLKEQAISLSRGGQPLSLAILGPNAKGKSSLIDAIEFYFSPDATLERVGKRAADRNAGRAAIEHIDAESKGITPAVQISFRQGNDKFGDIRPVTQAGTPPPQAATRVLADCPLPFVIRGHQLRGFVELQTPEERYKEIVAWFGLQPLLTIQKNLRALRKQLKQKVESTAERQERLRDLSRITGGVLSDWDETTVRDWMNDDVIGKLDGTLALKVISEADDRYEELKERKKVEDENLGIASLRRLLSNMEAVSRQPTGEEKSPSGTIFRFENAVTDYASDVAKEAAERTKASHAIFNGVWTSAKKLFDDEKVSLDACPVCDTKLSATPHGTRNAIVISLGAKLDDLTDYRKAEAALAAQKQELTQAHRALIEDLETLNAALEDDGYAHRTTSIKAYEELLTTWKIGHQMPQSGAASTEMGTLHAEIEAEKNRIEKEQGELTYANALKTADSIIKLKADLELIDRTKVELNKLNGQLNHQSETLNQAIADHIQDLVDGLRDSINDLYREIQGSCVQPPPIRLELPKEEDTNQQRLQLLVDFAENRKGVVPTGYLSDSQIHALALSLRLAAIQVFNPNFPFVALDDVVTSYDVDHRKNIAAVIAKHFRDSQIVLTTHDERFFALLQDHLPAGSWIFRRITDLKADFGPVFHDHRTPDELIQAKLDNGQIAANEIRQAEEEWLLDTCRDFSVEVVIRPIDRPFKYDRGELAIALATFLKKAGLAPPKVAGIANPFLVSLQKGEVENFGSHFSDNPNETWSLGDEEARWKEFKYFRDLFGCRNCSSKRFTRPKSLRLPVCSKCQTPFSFKLDATAS
jgi:hypothetical protein